MEHGFNLSTHKVERMYHFDTFILEFDYENLYANANFNKGADNLENFFTSMVSNIKPTGNYCFNLIINNSEPLEYEDYFTLFSAFGFVLANQGAPNKKGYLKVVDGIRDHVICTDYSMLKILNNDYKIGCIQLIVVDKEGYQTQWVTE